MDDKLTTIQIAKTTRDLLLSIGKKSETYDDVILRLIGLLEKNRLIIIENDTKER
jgi:hypothetical protein